ncbi:hypothetical protein RB608_16350 [Nocardioides sp. LHD-245]|uniref:hypothetical protein n=1 Tax=Nocardioides sp. LHD-245 TaxID=3051387 RepID=UPI0027DF64B0|nr:hypothetical protein [Nocardioides sp. LHD-245]
MDDQKQIVAQLVNEYAAVTVLLDRAPAGARLLLRAERTGDQVALDPVMLEALASLDARALGRLVEAFSETGHAGDAVPDGADEDAGARLS